MTVVSLRVSTMAPQKHVWLALALLIASFPALAHAAPEATPASTRTSPRTPTKVELNRFHALMAVGARAAKRGKHAAAIAVYERALVIKPNDQAALTDQGWSAFQLRLLDRAEAITRRAIAAVGNDRRRAAAQHNLGRILEARSNPAGAVAAYQASLELRPTRTVRERLGTLDPAAAAAADPLKPSEMLGPFAQLVDFCKTREEQQRTDCPAPGRGSKVSDVGGPYRDVVWFETGDRSTCFVALKLDRGWFVAPRGGTCESNAEEQVEIAAFEATDLVPGGYPEIVLRTNTTSMDLYLNGDETVRSTPKECEARLVACGVPPKGVPKCIYLQTGKMQSFCEKTSENWGWELQPVFSADGQVEVKGTGQLDADARLLMGRRPLAFP